MSDLQKKINQSLVWAEHQARVDCELRGGDVSEHWASIISSQYEELVSKVEVLNEINRLQSEENKQLSEDNAKLVEALTNVLHAESHNTGYEPSLSVFHRYVDEALQLLERIK